MHAAKTMPTPGATPLRTAPSRPKFFGVAPGVGGQLQASILTACIQKLKRTDYSHRELLKYRKENLRMPLLKAPPKQLKTTVVQLRLDDEAHSTLRKYAEYLECSPSHVVTEALKLVHHKDKQFQSWLAGQHTRICEPAPKTVSKSTSVKGESFQLELK